MAGRSLVPAITLQYFASIDPRGYLPLQVVDLLRIKSTPSSCAAERGRNIRNIFPLLDALVWSLYGSAPLSWTYSESEGSGLMKSLCVLAMLLLPLRGQVIPYNCTGDGTSTNADTRCLAAIKRAKDMLTCCALATLDQELMACVTTLEDMLIADKIRVKDYGAANPLAETRPDATGMCSLLGLPPVPCDVWTSSSACNCIVLNTGATNDDCEYSRNLPASDTQLAAILAHELCHAKTLNGTQTEAGWVDVCGYYANEVLCYCKELAVLDCLMAHCIAPNSLTAAGAQLLVDNRKRIADQKEAYESANKGC